MLLCLVTAPTAGAAAPPPDPGPASEPVAIGPAPADSTGPLTWGVTPTRGADAANRTAFTYTLESGRGRADAVRITNFSTTALALQVYAQDGVTTHDGGFDLLSGDQAATDLGTWVRIRARSVTVPARSRIDVPFLIEVPAGARPGDHTGGIVAAIVGERQSSDGQLVQVEQRVGARIYLRVPGEISAGLAVEQLRVRYETPLNPLTPGLTTLTYAVRNAGNVRLGAAPTVEVRSLAGLQSRAASGPVVHQILPGQVVTVVQSIPGMWPLVRLRAQAQAQPLPPPEASDIRAAPAKPVGYEFWAVPWPALALLAALVAVLLRRRWWSRITRGTPPPADSPKELASVNFRYL